VSDLKSECSRFESGVRHGPLPQLAEGAVLETECSQFESEAGHWELRQTANSRFSGKGDVNSRNSFLPYPMQVRDLAFPRDIRLGVEGYGRVSLNSKKTGESANDKEDTESTVRS
jgi:hypothetical protein